ncbi:MAG: RNA methyltransferase [Candidatus Kapabacteria bacterium]|jgi:TrmH family RNA methyltransferase|nr:RNA methyltransferase [Candidatus Kapabacteria bacterium]
MLFPVLSQADHQQIRSLQKRSERESQQRCAIEGEHLCGEYLALVKQKRLSKPYMVVVQEASSLPQAQAARISGLAEEFARLGTSVCQASERKFHLLADAQTPQGILAVIDVLSLSIETNKPMIILDAVADPGNVGTIIRTAEWFGINNILLGENCADRFHPKTLRATMGAAFRCAVQSTPHLAKTLREDFSHYTLYGASLQAETDLSALVFPENGSYGIVMGSEAHGISPEVQSTLHQTFRIGRAPASEAESLNVAVAAGVILHQCFARQMW